MTAIVLSYVRATSYDPDLTVIATFSLAGLALSLAFILFGVDLGTVDLG